MRRVLIALAGLAVFATSPAAADQVTATKPLPRGTVLSAEDLNGESGAVAGLVGRQLVRPIFNGRHVTLADTETPDLVLRQSPVAVVFRRGALTLSVTGRSMKSGGIGDTVPVRLEGRRQTLIATVTGVGEVEIAR